MESLGHVQKGSVFAPATSPDGLLEQWRAKGRIPVRKKNGHILGALIVSLDAPAKVGGVEVTALAECRATVTSKHFKFAIVIGPDRPEPLSLKTLWVQDLEKTGEWV